MAEVFGLYTISSTGSSSLVRNLDSGTVYGRVAAAGFKITAPNRKPILSTSSRRYAGQATVGETHENGSITWRALVKGTSAADALANVEILAGDLEPAYGEPRYLGGAPDGALSTTFYEVRGPMQYQTDRVWADWRGGSAMYVDCMVPVAPLARQDTVQSISMGTVDYPATVQLGTAVTGDAPALADISLRTSGGAAPPVWGMISYTARPGTPLSGAVAPFGLIQAETGTSVSGFGTVAGTAYHGGTCLRGTASGAGTATASFVVDPSVMSADDWARTVAVEVWARVEVNSSLVSPKVTASLLPNAGTAFGSPRYTAAYGASGKSLVLPSAGTVRRFTSLGVLQMPVDTTTPAKWNVTVTETFAAGSSGTYGIDYLLLTPTRTTALSPTGRALDSNYPKFVRGTVDTTRYVASNLAGKTGSGTANPTADAGLGGNPLELPPGNVDVLVKLSSLVPDDPTVDTTSEQLSHTSVIGTVTTIPRFWVYRR